MQIREVWEVGCGVTGQQRQSGSWVSSGLLHEGAFVALVGGMTPHSWSRKWICYGGFV